MAQPHSNTPPGRGGGRGRDDGRSLPGNRGGRDRGPGQRSAGPDQGRPRGRGDRPGERRDDRDSRDFRSAGGALEQGRDPDQVEGLERRWYPSIPDDVELTELSKSVQHSLDSLPESLGIKVGGHLVMTARMMAEDPQKALEHAQAGHDLAPRVVSVREALAIAAYNTGEYKVALREARTVRRMTGDESWLPLMADCERGLDRPERALDLLAAEVLAKLKPPVRAEALIVLSGARADLDQDQAAVAVLDTDLLRAPQKEVWIARLRFAFAEAQFRVGANDEGMKWLKLAVATDPDGSSGAADRLDELEGIEFLEILESSERASDTQEHPAGDNQGEPDDYSNDVPPVQETQDPD
jgi:hypothetical protein